MTLVRDITKKNSAKVFRRVSIKRRLIGTSGGFETTWLDITNKVKNWGIISTDIELNKLNNFRLNGVTLKVRNDDGAFNPTSDGNSLWNSFLTTHKTKVLIETGYLDDDGNETPGITSLWGKFLWGKTLWQTTPVNSSKFLGVINEEIILNATNEVSLSIKPLLGIFEEVPATRLSGLTGSQTASDIVNLVKNLVDDNSLTIFQDFISSSAWDIQATTTLYPGLNTTTAVDMSIWEMLKKLAQAENKAVWLDPDGTFHFRDKSANQSNPVWAFSGVGSKNPEFGHTIKSIESFKDATAKVFTRIRAQIDEADTSSSFVVKEENWNVGDSSTSWKFGQRTLELQNDWLNTNTAESLLSATLLDVSKIRKEITLSTKFIPALRLLDLVEMDYVSTNIGTSGTLWGSFRWGNAIWGGGNIANIFEIKGNYRVIGFKHNLDNMSSQFNLIENL